MSNTGSVHKRDFLDWDEDYPDGRPGDDPQAEANAPAIKNTWAQNKPAGTPERLDLPSGGECFARRPEIEEYARSGLLAEQDAMSSYVDQNLLRSGNPQKRKLAEEAAQKNLLRDGEAFGRLMMALDRLLPLILVEPAVKLHFTDTPTKGPNGESTARIPESKRRPGEIYTDQIPLEDKLHILGWIGGEDKAEPFRAESTPAVADVAAIPGVPVQGKRARKPAGRRS